MPRITRRQFIATSTGALVTAHLAAAGPPAQTLTFAAVSDTHITGGGSVALLSKAVDHINADTRIRFTAVLGDMATDGKPAELELAEAALAKLRRPWRAVPGNHDVAPGEDDPFGPYKAAFGPLHWVEETGGWTFIGFNSCEMARSNVTVSEAELAWLRAQAAGIAPGRPIALCCHHPMNPNTAKYRIANAEAILDIFDDRNLRLCAAGHWHGNQVETRRDTLFTTSACCATTRDNFDGTAAKGYRLYHAKPDGGLETEFVPVPPPK
ncbi:MAG: metallophosphoesterase family protein [Candidatus Hydrogenedentota bacterium]